MTTAADDSAVESAFEALLAGRPVPDEAAGLAAFTVAVRATATSPGRPSAALAELLATGRLTDQSSPSTVTAEPEAPPRAARRRRRRSTVLLPALVAKFLATGAVAKAATGAGIALVAVTGAGAAGVLPDPVQDGFASVVSTVTPLDPPTSEETPVDEPEVETPEVEDDGTLEEPEVEAPAEELTAEQWAEGPAPDQAFGAWVSEGARHGFAVGQVISEFAHQRNAERRGDVWVEVPVEEEPTEPEAEPAPEVTDSGAEVEQSGQRGNGGGRGNGGQGNGGGSGGGGQGGGRGR